LEVYKTSDDKKPLHLVLVEWVDSVSSPGWDNLGAKGMSMTCISVGWLVHDGDDRIGIVPNFHLDNERVLGNAMHELVIPRAAITNMQPLGG